MPWPQYLTKPTGPYADLVIQAHDDSNGDRQEIEQSDLAGCASCSTIFITSKEEIAYLEDGGPSDEWTALCPYCGVDSVIGSASGIPITEEFIAAATDYWTSPAGPQASFFLFDWAMRPVRAIECRIGRHEGRWEPTDVNCVYGRTCDRCGVSTTYYRELF